MRRFIEYYKWHLMFAFLVVVCLVFAFSNMVAKVSPDMVIGYADIRFINVQTFNDTKAQIELLMRDANGDGKKEASMVAYNADLQSDIDEVFLQMLEEKAYDVLIASKETFENVEDKSVFADAEEYAPCVGVKDGGALAV